MVLVAPRSAKLVETHGARFTLLSGYIFLFLAFLWMLLFWAEGSSYWQIALAYALIGVGVGLAGTPASHSLTGSVPVQRAGMASGTADLQRDLGGALLTSIFGALLASGYASAMGSAITSSPQGQSVAESTQAQLQLSYASATDLAAGEPGVRQRDPRGGKGVLPPGRRLGLHRRHRRDRAGRRPRVRQVPAQGRGGATPCQVPRRRYGGPGVRAAPAPRDPGLGGALPPARRDRVLCPPPGGAIDRSGDGEETERDDHGTGVTDGAKRAGQRVAHAPSVHRGSGGP